MEKYDVCHQSDYEKDFWKYCKSNLGKEKDLMQGLTKNCADYFKTKIEARNRNKLFCIPPWNSRSTKRGNEH